MAKYNKCDTCGGNLQFNPNEAYMECEHCGNVKPIKRTPATRRGSLVRNYSELYVLEPQVVDNKTYLCSACGTVVSFEEDDVKRRCPSCGSIGLNHQERSVFVPDGIVPFGVNRESAVEIFRQWIANRKFAPRDLKQMAKNGKISGLYVPAWNFNCRLQTYFDADVTTTEEHGEKFFTRHHYPNGVEEKTFANVLVSANNCVDDGMIDELEPFDVQKMVPYSSEYVCGFSGVDTNTDIHEKFAQIKSQKEDLIESTIRRKLKSKYEMIESINFNHHMKNCSFSYTYIPIWANHYSYNKKQYHCYINGQTGKAVGKAPKSFWKILGLVGGIVAAIGILALIII